MKVVALALCLILFAGLAARASMPELTVRPKVISSATCEAWAGSQKTEAKDMWGIKQDGTSSVAAAMTRLTRWCLSQKMPEIVGFGSSVGFDEAYCKNHPTIKLCRDRGLSR